MAANVTQQAKLARAVPRVIFECAGRHDPSKCSGPSDAAKRLGEQSKARRKPGGRAGDLPVAQIALGEPQVVLRLKVHPELSRGLEKTREKNSRLWSHATLAVDDRVYPLDRDL